jgi:hypothetical protein
LTRYYYDQQAIIELETISKSISPEQMKVDKNLFSKILQFIRILPRITTQHLNEHIKKNIIARPAIEKPFNQLYKIINTTGNGNCLYNAISIALKGAESLCNLLRLLTVYSLLNEYQYFGKLAETCETQTLLFYIHEAAKNHHWGRDDNDVC